MEEQFSTNVFPLLIDVDLLPIPSVIISDLIVLKYNFEFCKLLPPDFDNVADKKIDEVKLFKDNLKTKEFYQILKSGTEVTDFPLSLWNGTPIFATTRAFKQNGSYYLLITLNRFSLVDVNKVNFIFGNIEYLKSILNKFDFWVTIRDRNSNLVLCNSSFEKFIGLTQAELIGKNIDDLFGSNEISRLHRETDIELLGRRKEQVHFHIQVKGKNGKTHFLEVTKFLVNFGGEDFVFCISIDTSELDYVRQLYEESSTLYRALIENAFDAIYLLKGRHYIYANPRFCELTGYTIEELLSPSFDFSVLVTGESKKFLEERYRARMEGKEIPNQYELEIVNKSGKKIFVEVNTVSVGKPGEVVVMGIMRDITQRKLFEEQLKKSEEELRQLNYSKDKLFNIIAHDLRSPLSGLISMTKMLIETIDILSPKEAKELLTDLFEYANQSYNLLENLLQWAKTQTGTILFNPEITDLYEIVLAGKIINDPNAKQKGINISIFLKPNSFVLVDRNMLTTVIRNLISNAIKFTPSGGEINIRLHEKSYEYELEIEDNGIGIPKDKLDSLFKLGENISTTGTAGEKGSGLGLILCKEFVEKNDGNLRVVSEFGKGTKFFINLPKYEEKLS